MRITKVTRQPDFIWKDYEIKTWLTKNDFPKNGENRPFPSSDRLAGLLSQIAVGGKERQ